MNNQTTDPNDPNEALLIAQYRSGFSEPASPIDLPAFGQRLLEMVAQAGNDELAKSRLIERLIGLTRAINLAYSLHVMEITSDKAVIEVQRFIDSLKLPAID